MARSIDAVYDDGEKVGEVHHETTFLGKPKDVLYDNDGNIVSETFKETTFLGKPIDVTYDTEGSKVSTTYHETTLSGKPVDVAYDSHGNVISKTRNEERGIFFPKKVRVVEYLRAGSTGSFTRFSPCPSGSRPILFQD